MFKETHMLPNILEYTGLKVLALACVPRQCLHSFNFVSWATKICFDAQLC